MGPGGELVRGESMNCKHHGACERYGLQCAVFNLHR